LATKVLWADEVAPGDLDAAERFLSLLYPESRARTLREALARAPVVHYAAKDIMRASGMPLRQKDPDVIKHQRRIRKGKPLSPVLLVRQELGRMVIADGYHRLCAALLTSEQGEVPCRIV
jgi:hypothetical protein